MTMAIPGRELLSASVVQELTEYLDRYGRSGVALGDVLCDAHAGGDAVVLTCEGPDGVTAMTYRELSEASRRLAGALVEVGVGVGDRVAVLLPKSPELLVTLLAIWRCGAVHVPLFTAFGPDAVDYRLAHSRARLVVTDVANRSKVTLAGASGVPVLCVGASADGGAVAGDLDFTAAVDRSEPLEGVARDPEDLFILLYTSGTTGQPKGVEVPIRALASMRSYLRHGLDVRDDDVYWNFADPGWAYGLYFGIVGPLLLGQSILWRSVPFDAADMYEAILRHQVTNLAGAPTVYRSLRAAAVPAGFRDASRLRAISSAGEPLNAQLLEWSERELGVAIHDHYGQSELGMAVYFSQDPELHREPVAGSMGVPAPGIRAVVLDDTGTEVAPGTPGELAIDIHASPAYWFRGYFRDPERTAERFPHGERYYLTSDATRLEASGLLFFASRADDVITSSGYRIGPFEVESALIAHPAVAEVAVIGTPDELRVEAVTAYVVLAPTANAGSDLTDELQQFVKTRLAKHLYPRRVVFVDALPRTASGKVMRTELRKDWASRTTQPDTTMTTTQP
jgi:acetyl-CoA synthetase